jgi:hypothetical protein
VPVEAHRGPSTTGPMLQSLPREGDQSPLLDEASVNSTVLALRVILPSAEGSPPGPVGSGRPPRAGRSAVVVERRRKFRPSNRTGEGCALRSDVYLKPAPTGA